MYIENSGYSPRIVIEHACPDRDFFRTKPPTRTTRVKRNIWILFVTRICWKRDGGSIARGNKHFSAIESIELEKLWIATFFEILSNIEIFLSFNRPLKLWFPFVNRYFFFFFLSLFVLSFSVSRYNECIRTMIFKQIFMWFVFLFVG